MSFLKSAVNQVGRDLGKVVSNSIFNDAHASPYRQVRTIRQTSSRSKQFKSEFEKAINFQLGHRPSMLINKISGVYTVIKNETNYFLNDGYLDTTESELLFEMMSQFNDKIDDICDVLEIDEDANSKEIAQLSKIINKTTNLFKEALQVAAKGCQFRKIEHTEKAANIIPVDFFRYVGLHLIWMGNYARGGEMSILKTIIANLADVIFMIFPFTRVYLFIKGITSYYKEKDKRQSLKKAHLKLSDLEEKRSLNYLSIYSY